ncbi:NADH-ubiquinone oxidoreductase chain [Olea europaea subsp. europaea]|uniref:NADH-ubiquinone oxidoreductase chain n=1 Tax=Olea europaea subsp. europaea TaxID=158383 RepID=A0A8S0SE94_OLEEU|nr:NADH-ubiquinone oxidoreductase chain [Olea europaea subsp. europaea]
MITRSKLVEQLRDYQIRSQHKCPALTVFSPKPSLSSWIDVAVAIFLALLFGVLLLSSYITLYLRHYWISLVIICLAIFLPVSLRISRQNLAKKKERRSMLPLSM